MSVWTQSYTEGLAVSRLLRNGAQVKDGKITIARPGISLLGAIDYLEKKHRYVWMKGDKGGK